MPAIINPPNKEDLQTAVAGAVVATGKINVVSVQQNGGCGVGITGGQNPGTYPIRASVTGGTQAALVALTNKATVWAPLEQGQWGLEIVTLAVYPT
jgi:hypothetical protein